MNTADKRQFNSTFFWQEDVVISECQGYRPWLRRKTDREYAAFIMLNLSTADAVIDDRTVTRCRGFAEREECHGIVVVNLFTKRSPYPKDLWVGEDPVGPQADDALDAIVQGDVAKIICAWGGVPSGTPSWGQRLRLDRINTVLDKLNTSDRQLYALGTCKDGSPRHPLYLAADTPLVPYAPTAKQLSERKIRFTREERRVNAHSAQQAFSGYPQ